MSTPSVYRGRSVEELIPRIQAELGEDAIVLRRRTGLTGGIGGFFQRQFAEIEAQPGGPRVDLYDENPDTPVLPAPLSPASRHASEDPPPGVYAQPTARGIARPAGAYVAENLAALAMAPPGVSGSGQPQPFEPESFTTAPLRTQTDLGLAPSTPQPESFTAALAAAELEVFEPLQDELQRIEPTPPSDAAPATASMTLPAPAPVSTPAAAAPTAAPVPAPTAAPTPAAAPRSRARAGIERSLTDLGMSAQFANELIDAAAAHVLPLAPRLSLTRAVHRALVQAIPACSPLPAASASIALVGSGGSGKTSCCASLLAAYRKGSTLRASCATLVTDDEQAEHSLVLSPMVMTPTPISAAIARRALASAREQGLLLLDTPSLSPAERPAIRKLTGLLGELQPDRIVVALPATLGAKAAAQLLEALAPLGAGAVAITHADETDQLGVAIEAACRFGLAPEYILDRGRARGRLLQIDPTYLADRLLGVSAT